MPALTVNLDLVRKYAKPGPRYTSYPTAPQFTETFDRDRLAAAVKRVRLLSNPDKGVTTQVLVALCLRFRPDRIDGIIDGECRAKLLALLLPRPQGEP